MTYEEAREIFVQIYDAENGLMLPGDWREAMLVVLEAADIYEDLRNS